MDVKATFTIRILASLVILVPVLCGFVLQALLGIALYSVRSLTVFLLGWKTFKLNSFYLITLQLMWCDVCALTLDLFFAFPLTLTGVQYMGDSMALYYIPFGIRRNRLSMAYTISRYFLLSIDFYYSFFQEYIT
ncbi:hypothetical protein COOONC_24484 [Cooperia oncophora]